jgi:hypothetical protein
MGHSSIQVTVDIYHHYVQGSNKQAVDRLDEPVDNQKTEGESATIRNREDVVRWERSGFSQNLLRKLEPAIRIERTTCGLRRPEPDDCSNTESPPQSSEPDDTSTG